jgi:hypothetical protein
MASSLIPPMPNGVVPGSVYWNDWIEKLRTIINSLTSGISWNIITGKPTTLSGYGITDPVELTTHKDTANGYAGLTSVSRISKGVSTTDYIVANSSTKGLTMLSPNGHYWVATISNTGVVTWTDVGTTSP